MFRGRKRHFIEKYFINAPSPLFPHSWELYLLAQPQAPGSLQIRSRRTGVYRYKLGQNQILQLGSRRIDRKLKNWSLQIESCKLQFIDRKYEYWSLHIESRRNGVYRQKVGELEFTDRKQEKWSLQIESCRTGVWKLIFFKQLRKRNLILFVSDLVVFKRFVYIIQFCDSVP